MQVTLGGVAIGKWPLVSPARPLDMIAVEF